MKKVDFINVGFNIHELEAARRGLVHEVQECKFRLHAVDDEHKELAEFQLEQAQSALAKLSR